MPLPPSLRLSAVDYRSRLAMGNIYGCGTVNDPASPALPADHGLAIANRASSSQSRPLMKPIRKAIFPVAGLGTRFLPATKAMPKEMLPVVDRPLIQHVVDEARAGRHRAFHLRHRPQQERHRGPFRPPVRARDDAARAPASAPSSTCCRRTCRRPAPRASRASRSRSASATRCGARANWSATSRSRCCCPTCWCSTSAAASRR